MLSFVSCNVSGLGSDKRRYMRSWLTDRLNGANPDFLFLQETHAAVSDFRDLESTVFGNYDCFFAAAGRLNPSTGVAIAIRRSARVKSCELLRADEEGRYVFARVTLSSLGVVDLACTYAPASISARQRQEFFDSLPWHLLGQSAIVAGDWNCTLALGEHLVSDGQGPSRPSEDRHRRPDAVALTTRAAEQDLLDPATIVPLRGQLFSRAGWAGPNGAYVRSRIDRFFVSRGLTSRIAAHAIDNTAFQGSDHHPVRLKLRLSQREQGADLWRMHPYTPSLNGIDTLVNELVDRFEASAEPATDRYNQLVSRLADMLERAEKEDMDRRALRIEEARKRVKDAEARFCAAGRHPRAVAEFRAAREALDDLQQVRARRRLDKRMQRHLRHGDKPTAQFFASFNRRAGDDNYIESLNGVPADAAPEALANAGAEFYKALFTKRPSDPAAVEACMDAIRNKVPEEKRRALAEPLTKDELEKAVRKIPVASAPGLDGLRSGLYKKFSRLLDPVLETFNYCMEHRVPLPRALSDGVIVLLFKKGDRRQLENYRPVTLLSVAIKAIAGALAARINSVLRDLVGPNQTGFMKGRDIRSNIYEVMLAHQAAKRDRVSGAIVFLDMKKAYDKLSHDFLLRVLEKMEFPPYFTDAVRLLLTNCQSALVINGFVSRFFELLAGVPQGSPLSPALFVLATEPLRAALQHAPVPGLVVAGIDLRCNMYADFRNFFVGSQASFNQFQRLLRTWCSAATMEVNVGKSVAITFGRNPPDVQPYRSLRQDEFERVLGARIGEGEDDNPVWSQVDAKLRGKIERYARFRHLPLFGRVVLANACILSHIWYASSFLSVDEMDLRGAFKLSNHFVWDPTPGFRKAMAYSQSCRPAVQGGVGLLDPELEVSAIHAYRLVCALCSEEDGAWRHLLWDAILHVVPRNRMHLTLSRKWTRAELGHSLAADILLAFTSLDVENLPRLPPPAPIAHDAARGRFAGALPPLPARDTVASANICGSSTAMEDLTVKAIYRFLRAKKLDADPRQVHQLDLERNNSPMHWARRWTWLKFARLPPRARQTNFLRWHGRLYMGQTSDDPEPQCPHCGETDSQLHFVQECPVALHVRHMLVAYWMVWRPALSRDTLLSWWNDEVAPKVPQKAEWNEEHQLRSAFMASWAMLVHGLYRQRVAAAAANNADADHRARDRDDQEFRRTAALVVAAWKQELRNLLWAYARVDIDMPSERNGIDTWRASFALSEWHRDVPGGLNPFDQIVVIAFPDESRDDPGAARADDLPAPDLPGDEPADANL